MSLLEQYRFDAERFEAHRARLQATPFTPALAHLAGPFRPLERDKYVPADGPIDDRATALGRDALARGEVAVVLLNGGMATRFGGVAKGAARAFGAKSFL